MHPRNVGASSSSLQATSCAFVGCTLHVTRASACVHSTWLEVEPAGIHLYAAAAASYAALLLDMTIALSLKAFSDVFSTRSSLAGSKERDTAASQH